MPPLMLLLMPLNPNEKPSLCPSFCAFHRHHLPLLLIHKAKRNKTPLIFSSFPFSRCLLDDVSNVLASLHPVFVCLRSCVGQTERLDKDKDEKRGCRAVWSTRRTSQDRCRVQRSFFPPFSLRDGESDRSPRPSQSPGPPLFLSSSPSLPFPRSVSNSRISSVSVCLLLLL